MIERVEPEICLDGLCYRPCSINYDQKKLEVFYHFSYAKWAKVNAHNYVFGSATGLPEHISFHGDGAIHVKLIGDNKPFGRKEPGCSFIPKNKDEITVLLVCSIFKVNGKYIISLSKEEEKTENFFTTNNDFSIVIFLTPDNITQEDLFSKLPIGERNWKEFRFFPGDRMPVWTGWAIDYMFTDLTLPFFDNNQGQGNRGHIKFAYSNLHCNFKDFLFKRPTHEPCIQDLRNN